MMEFFSYISFILLHNPCPIGMNGLQETVNGAKNHTYFILGATNFPSSTGEWLIPSALPTMPEMLLWSCTEFLAVHNG